MEASRFFGNFQACGRGAAAFSGRSLNVITYRYCICCAIVSVELINDLCCEYSNCLGTNELKIGRYNKSPMIVTLSAMISSLYSCLSALICAAVILPYAISSAIRTTAPRARPQPTGIHRLACLRLHRFCAGLSSVKSGVWTPHCSLIDHCC